MAASLINRPIAKIVLAVIAAFIGLAIAQFAFKAFTNRPGAVEDAFDAAALEDPNTGPMFKAMQRHFPAEYAALRTELVAQARAGASKQSIGALGFARLSAFRDAHLRDIAKAPSLELQAYRKAQAALLVQLGRESPEMCARYTFARLAQTDRPSPAGQKALADFGVAQFRAIAGGQKRPVARATDAPQPQDIQALAAAMKAEGLSPRHLAFFQGEPGAAALNETEKCDTGLAMTRALLKLPVEQADRISAVLVVHS